MTSTTTLMPSHAEGIKRLLRRSILLYKSAFFYVLPLALILTLVAFSPQLLALMIGVDVFANLPPSSPQHLWLFFINVAILVFFTAMLWHLRCYIVETHDRIQEDMVIALKKIPHIIIAALIQTFLFAAISISFSIIAGYIIIHSTAITFDVKSIEAILVALILLLQVSIALYFYFSFYFYLPIILMEDQGALRALRKSTILVSGNWWRVFIVQSIPWLVYITVLIFLKVFFGVNFNIYLFSPATLTVPATLLHMLIFLLIIPWSAATLLIQLHNLELKKHLIILNDKT